MVGADGGRSRSTSAWRRAVDWLLLSGNRYAVAGLTVAAAAGVGFTLRPVAAVSPDDATPLLYAFSALLGGNLNLLTIVLSINQLVFSRELQPPGEFRDIEAGVEEFRGDVADAVGAPEADALPVVPSAFARRLVDATRASLDGVRDAVAERSVDVSDDTARRLRRLDADLAAAADCLDDPGSPTFAALEATLRVGLADGIHALGTLRRNHGERLGEDGRDAVAAASSRLRLVTVAREYFKSLYTQEELSKLSVVLLVVGVPAEIAVAYVLVEMVGLLQAIPPDALAPGWTYAALAVGFVPLAIVFSFVLRAATIAHRSATTTQFAGPPRQQRDE